MFCIAYSKLCNGMPAYFLKNSNITKIQNKMCIKSFRAEITKNEPLRIALRKTTGGFSKYFLSFFLKFSSHSKLNLYFIFCVNLLSVSPTKLSNTLKQFVGKRTRIVSMCLTILWGWRLKG